MGDNRDDFRSTAASRLCAGGVGLVPVENLVGRVDAILGSWDPIVRHDPVWTWPAGLRFSRFFSRVKFDAFFPSPHSRCNPLPEDKDLERGFSECIILITGAAGMVGRKLTERLVADGGLNGKPIDKLTLVDVVAPKRAGRLLRQGRRVRARHLRARTPAASWSRAGPT